MNPNITRLIQSVIVMGVVLAIALLTFGRIDKYLKIKAIDDCGRVARNEKTLPNENAKLTYPLADSYIQCLKDKGYR